MRVRCVWIATLLAALLGGALLCAQQATPQKAGLGGADRLLGHVATDKPVYRPGETIYGRVLLLNAFDRKPAAGSPYVSWRLLAPKGDPVTTKVSETCNGSAAFAYTIPDDQAGGLYSLEASFPWTGDSPAIREISIRSYRQPRLKTDIEFLRKAYGPGDEVQAELEAERAEGGAPTGATAVATAMLDGRVIFRGRTPVLREGRWTAKDPHDRRERKPDPGNGGARSDR
ncbi:MG2 domain-containing protein [Planctomycetota bacterium]